MDLKVKLDRGTAQQYRVQVRFGKELKNSRWYPYAKFGAVDTNTQNGHVAVADYDYVHAQSTYDGWRVEFGAGTTYRLTDRSQFYLDYAYGRASLYEIPWNLNLGYRRVW